MTLFSDTDAPRAVFTAGGAFLALGAGTVRRVLPMPLIETLPTAPPVVLGVIRHAGEVVPVLALHALLGLAETPVGLYSHLLLVVRDGRPLAFMVDRVLALTPPVALVSLDGDAMLSFNGCALGRFRFAEREVTLLDGARLLTAVEDRLVEDLRAMAVERAVGWRGADA